MAEPLKQRQPSDNSIQRTITMTQYYHDVNPASNEWVTENQNCETPDWQNFTQLHRKAVIRKTGIDPGTAHRRKHWKQLTPEEIDRLSVQKLERSVKLDTTFDYTAEATRLPKAFRASMTLLKDVDEPSYKRKDMNKPMNYMPPGLMGSRMAMRLSDAELKLCAVTRMKMALPDSPIDVASYTGLSPNQIEAGLSKLEDMGLLDLPEWVDAPLSSPEISAA